MTDLQQLIQNKIEEISKRIESCTPEPQPTKLLYEDEPTNITEFSQWLTQFILELGGRVPNVEEWKTIKQVLDSIVEKENTNPWTYTINSGSSTATITAGGGGYMTLPSGASGTFYTWSGGTGGSDAGTVQWVDSGTTLVSDGSSWMPLTATTNVTATTDSLAGSSLTEASLLYWANKTAVSALDNLPKGRSEFE